MAAGGGLTWLVYTHPENASAPLPVVFGVCGLFFLAGLAVAVGGLGASLRRARHGRLLRERPHEPWHADYKWDPQGQRERPFWKALNGVLGIGFLALFLAPFNWWLFTAPEAVVVIVVGLFDLLLIAALLYWAYDTARSLKYGAPWIRFGRFPFFLGERLDVVIGGRGAFDRFDKLVVTVRFIQESRVRQGNRTSTRCHQHWAERLELDPRTLHGVRELPVSLELPADARYDTCLSDDNARYWEVEVNGEAPGIDFHAQFLVPVYAR